MLRERGKGRKRERKRERESLLRRIGVRLWQEKEVGGEQERGRMWGRMMKGAKDRENQVQTGRSGRERRKTGGWWRKRCRGRRQLVRFRESRLGVGAKMSRREEVMGERCKGK